MRYLREHGFDALDAHLVRHCDVFSFNLDGVLVSEVVGDAASSSTLVITS
jgi:hypothetical protein